MPYAYEKRDFEPVKVNTAMTLYYSEPQKVVEEHCVNFSTRGVGLQLSAVVAISTECQGKMHDGIQNRGPFQALIEIRHIEPLEKCRCRVGAIILEMF